MLSVPGAVPASKKHAPSPSRIEISSRGLGADGLGVTAASAAADDLATAVGLLAVATVAAAATETAAAVAVIGAFFRCNRRAGSAEPPRLLTTRAQVRARTRALFRNLGARGFARLIGRTWKDSHGRPGS